MVEPSISNVLVTGASGLVGSELMPALQRAGCGVRTLSRSAPQTPGAIGRFTWDPSRGLLDPMSFEGVDALVHLAGDGIANGRWTAEKKRGIRESRIQGTRLLCDQIRRSTSRPKVWISASAVGWYGDRADEILDESSAPGTGFLADVCRDWEAEARPAMDLGVRVVFLRLGVVLSPRGGALARMLPAFRLGLGGPLGSGNQYLSWIAMPDLIRVILHLLTARSVSGPVNAVSPEPVRQRDFAAVLGRIIHRPALLPTPAFALKLLFGEMAQATLLSSARVMPARLLEEGFQFQSPGLDSALASCGPHSNRT